jgi:DNA invertase Pin-like site-specific DNA recombinase
MKAIYLRISTANQNIERQLRKDFEKVFIDVCNGSVPFDERPEATRLKNDPSITFIQVEDVDRLGRNLKDVLTQLDYFTSKKINLFIERHGITTLVKGEVNSTAKILIQMLGIVAELESNNIKERTRQGVAIAKAKGKYKGKQRGATTSIEKTRSRHAQIIPIVNSYRQNGISWLGIEKRLKASGFLTANRITLKRLHELKLVV